jgi:hypothetical protein
MSSVVKFPYSVSRRVHSKKPRASKNGTPEERAAKAAAGVKEKPVKPPRRMMTGVDFDEFVRLLEDPERQQAFMVDAWKLVNRHFRRLARGD